MYIGLSDCVCVHACFEVCACVEFVLCECVYMYYFCVCVYYFCVRLCVCQCASVRVRLKLNVAEQLPAARGSSLSIILTA